MRMMGHPAARVLKHPGAFAVRTLKSFRANQGLLLAGAVAYYALLSIVPLMILTVIALSHFIDQGELLQTLGHYLEWLVPGQSGAIIEELANFLDHRDVMSWVLFVTMLFFSSLAFTVLENAMSVIFHHRVAIRRRHFLVSAVIPYCYILSLGLGLLLVTLVAGSLQAMGQEQVEFLGRDWSLGGVSGVAAVPSRRGRRDLRTHLRLPGHAGSTTVAVARTHRRHRGDDPLGADAPCAGVVLRHPVPDRHSLWIADYRNRSAAEPRACGDVAAVGCPGDCRIRASRQRRLPSAAETDAP